MGRREREKREERKREERKEKREKRREGERRESELGGRGERAGSQAAATGAPPPSPPPRPFPHASPSPPLPPPSFSLRALRNCTAASTLLPFLPPVQSHTPQAGREKKRQRESTLALRV